MIAGPASATTANGIKVAIRIKCCVILFLQIK